MNIFYLSDDPIEAAKYMVDRHVIKMVLESAQLLSTAHRVLDGVEAFGISASGRKKTVWLLPDVRNTFLYSATHVNHPCSIWTRGSVDNYVWLVQHFFALSAEYSYRYGKTHASFSKLNDIIKIPPTNIAAIGFTSPAIAMSEEYIIGSDPINNYRNYYKHGKSHLHKWTKREIPHWI